MTARIFRGIFYVSLISMVLSLVFIIGVQYQFYDESQSAQLKEKAEYIATALNAAPDDYLKQLSQSDDRITLIDTDGTVLFDNRIDIATAGNHLDREEVKEALKNGFGVSERYSSTLSEKTSYYALRLKDGRVLRVADESSSVFAVLVQLLPPLAAIVLLSVVLSIVLASVLSKRIVSPINALDPNRPILEESYEELAPLVSKINAQNRKIERQINRLTQSSRQFQVISDNMNEGLLLTDRDCKILTYNKSILGLFHIEHADSLIGKSLLTLNRSEPFRTVVDRLSEGLHASASINLENSYCDMIANPVFNENGDFSGGVILIVDVTEKENREKLRREFTANVSHELKTPLTSIYGISEMLKNGLVDPKDIPSFAGDINTETARLIALVGDIIRLSQLDEGLTPELNERVELVEVVKETCARFTPIAEQKNVSLQIQGKPITVRGNLRMLSELLHNLVENAIKYNVDGGAVTVTTGTAYNRPFLQVSDTGIGIPTADSDRVFERFYRVDKSHSKQSGGTGLGLSIVKHIAACHHAQLTLESTLGKGSTFTVTFENET